MTDFSSPAANLDSIQALLEPARQRLVHRMRSNEIRRAATLILAAAAVAGLIELLAIVLPGRGMSSIPLRVHVFAAVVLVSSLIAGTVLAFRGLLRRRPGWLDVAQRLDAACDPHNRVATALDLLERGASSAFERAAVEQGVHQLRQASGQNPVLPSRQPLPRTSLLWCAGAVLLLGIAVTVVRPPYGEHAAGTVSAEAGMGGLNPHTKATNVLAEATPDRLHSEVEPASDAEATGAGERNGLQANSGEPRRPGKSGAGSTGRNGRLAKESSATASDRSQASKASAGAPSKPTRSPKSESSSRSQGEPSDASTGAISGGGAGRGRSLAVKSQGVQRESPAGTELESIDDDGEIEDELSSNQQRGGVQPSLPDRTEAPSRELGITGPQSGRPGTGRGGPSPAKKSRGAAAMLMGVPIPDFVKGKAGPGPTAVSLEETAPTPILASVSSAAPARPRSEDESPIRSHDIAWSDAALVQEYCRRWQARSREAGRTTAGETTEPQTPFATPSVNQGANP